MLQNVARRGLWFAVDKNWHEVHKLRWFSTKSLGTSEHRKGWWIQTRMCRVANLHSGSHLYISSKQPVRSTNSQPSETPTVLTRPDRINLIVDDLYLESRPPTPEEWPGVGEQFSRLIPNAKQWPSVLMKIIAGRMKNFEEQSDKSLNIANSLLAFARQLEAESPDQRSARVSVALLVSFMNIYGHSLTLSKTHDKDAEVTLVKLYSEIQTKAPLLDMDSSVAVIEALCSSKNLWRQSLDVLTRFKEVFPPAAGQVVPIIAAAFRYDGAEVGEHLLDDLASILRGQAYSFTRMVDDSIVLAVVEKARRDDNSEHVRKLLGTMQEHQWFLSNTAADQFIQYFER